MHAQIEFSVVREMIPQDFWMSVELERFGVTLGELSLSQHYIC